MTTADNQTHNDTAAVGRDLAGLRAVVTGGASGIGLATAEMLQARGAQTVVLDREPSAGHGLTAVAADLADGDSVAAAMKLVIGELGGLDIVVNNAGIGAQGTVTDNDDDEWCRVLNVNLLGIVRVCRSAVPELLHSSRAAIVNTCSVAATVGLPNRALYSASKGAVLSLTRAMAADYVGNIRVNCVLPGTADTPWIGRLMEQSNDPQAERAALNARQPMGRLVTAEEVAFAIVNLASPLSSATTGSAVVVDGGLEELRVPAAGTPVAGGSRRP